jgi:bifunctional DNA-binding transcriptional regulator/antitoxin component of YhaV-PrlF toxin-antitoxin module
MAVSTTIQIGSNGTLTLPIELRRKYGLDEGDMLTLIDLGEGSFLLTPVVTQVDRAGHRVAKAMADEGASVDEILVLLDEERKRLAALRFRFFRED